MQVPMMADVEHGHRADVGEPIRCAVVLKPTEAQRQKKEMLRHVVVVIALLAVLLLIAIAFYYTAGQLSHHQAHQLARAAPFVARLS